MLGVAVCCNDDVSHLLRESDMLRDVDKSLQALLGEHEPESSGTISKCLRQLDIDSIRYLRKIPPESFLERPLERLLKLPLGSSTWTGEHR
jgi:hypothetical protein